MIAHRVDIYRYGDELERIKAKQGKPCKVLFYGSSTFAIWQTLEEEFSGYNAINAGFGGSTSDEALFHYENIAKPFAPDVLVWYFGDNEPVCGYTAEETETLFKSTWDRFIADNPKIKIITVLTKVSPARDEFKDFVAEVNAWQKKIAQENENITYIETYDICKKDGEYILENYLPDELHFGRKGYDILFKRIKEALDR